MASLANLNGDTLPKLKCFNVGGGAWRRMTIVGLGGSKNKDLQDNQPHLLNANSVSVETTRRVVLGLAAVAVSAQIGIDKSLADDNGYWLTTPIPIPPIYNKIANEETGTRSFLKKGIFMPNIGTKGSIYRLKKYAFDLMGLGDLIGQDAWSYVRKYLRLKSTVMYYDFDKIISAAPANDKQPLTDLANRLFDSVEKLEDAVKKQSLPKSESCYQDTTNLLQEVMKMA